MAQDGGYGTPMAQGASLPVSPVEQLRAMLASQPKPTKILSMTARAIKQRLWRAKAGESYRAKHREEERKWRAKNSELSNGRARSYRARNPDKVRCANLKKKHGITLDQFNALFNSQGNKCAICRRDEPRGKNWHVDHCHQTGNIRGILCHSCNLMIGQACDNVETLLAAVEYLK